MAKVKTARFSVGQLMTVVSGKGLCSDKEYIQILDYITGRPINRTHTPTLRRICAQHLLTQFPWLEQADPDRINADNADTWVKCMGRMYGLFHDVEQIQVMR